MLLGVNKNIVPPPKNKLYIYISYNKYNILYILYIYNLSLKILNIQFVTSIFFAYICIVIMY